MNSWQKSITVIKALKSCLTAHNKPRMIQSDNGGEFSSREFKQFLLKYSIEHKFGPTYRPKWQGAVESLTRLFIYILKLKIPIKRKLRLWVFRKWFPHLL